MNRGPKPKGKVKLIWGSRFAYAIGLLVSDGCLSKNGRHVSLTSKDKVQLTAFNKCLDISVKISRKYSGAGRLSYYVQFSDVLFYRFLMSIGLMPAKSKILSELDIPTKYFFDFLRGYFDGDGSSYSYYDPMFPASFRFYISFASGSEEYVMWLQKQLYRHARVKGFISRKKNTSHVQLKYAKREAGIIAQKMYYHKALICLERKRKKIVKAVQQIQRMSEW